MSRADMSQKHRVDRANDDDDTARRLRVVKSLRAWPQQVAGFSAGASEMDRTVIQM